MNKYKGYVPPVREDGIPLKLILPIGLCISVNGIFMITFVN